MRGAAVLCNTFDSAAQVRFAMGKSSNNREVKRNNRLDTLRAILASGRISQPALAARLGHSGPTVLQNVRELMALGLVQEAGMFDSTGGRKAKAFAPVCDAGLAVGLEITRTHLGVALIDLAGHLLFHERHKLPFAMTTAYLTSLGSAVTGLLAQQAVPEGRLLGVGISLPGIVDRQGAVLTSSHVLRLYNVQTENFRRFLPYPCFFINDANAAALAEVHGGEDGGSLVYLSLSNSVGGAILTNGRLYAGDHQRAGEFGHNTLVPGGRRCYCGKQGCLDAYCNTTVLSDLAEGSLALFFERLHSGNPGCTAAWQTYLENLAVAVNNLHMSFDCKVVAGGYVGSYMEAFAPNFPEMLAARNPFEPDGSYFRFCRHRVSASAIGAALLPVEDFLQRI